MYSCTEVDFFTLFFSKNFIISIWLDGLQFGNMKNSMQIIYFYILHPKTEQRINKWRLYHKSPVSYMGIAFVAMTPPLWAIYNARQETIRCLPFLVFEAEENDAT